MPYSSPVYYLQISSITHAYRGQEILRRHGITAYVHRDRRFASSKGCGYLLMLRHGNPEEVRQLLLEQGVRVLGGKDGDGHDLF